MLAADTSTLAPQDIDYTDGTTALRGRLFRPANAGGSTAGIVLFHDARGISGFTLDRAQALCRLGHTVLAADSYGESVAPGDMPRMMALITGLKQAPGVWRSRARAALAALVAQPGVDAGRLAAVGHCFGGSTALELWRDGAALQAVVSFHGHLDTSSPATAQGSARAGVLVCTGADDPLIPPPMVVGFLDELRQAQMDDAQVHVYSGARHSFTSEDADRMGVPAMAYHAAAARRSWAAMCALFDERLARAA